MMTQPIPQAPATRARNRIRTIDSSQTSRSKLHSLQPEKRSSVENLACYRLTLDLCAFATTFVPRGHASLRDQLDRATTSTLLNLAEGWGRWQPREKSHFYTIARGSVLESAAVIDLLRARNLAYDDNCARARAMALRIAQMLGGLIHGVGSRITTGGRR